MKLFFFGGEVRKRMEFNFKAKSSRLGRVDWWLQKFKNATKLCVWNFSYKINHPSQITCSAICIDQNFRKGHEEEEHIKGHSKIHQIFATPHRIPFSNSSIYGIRTRISRIIKTYLLMNWICEPEFIINADDIGAFAASPLS